ncbi:MAG: FAD-binding oxidoreductase [Pseudomonadota bacterium]|nr:FAD-binding oxidoreductase [Pseudomonadota bacterium]
MNHNSENVSSIWSGDYHSSINPPNNTDVVIIGGGIIGVSTAYFLTKAGVKVCLCEKGFISGEQSGRNWGYVRVQGRDEREIPMMQESLNIWRNFNSELGYETGFEQGGCIYTAYNEKELKSYQSWLKLADKYNIKTEMIDKEGLSNEVGLGASNWLGGIITRTDGRAEPQKATLAIARAAQNLGATIITGCAVRGLETSGGKLSRIITEKGSINTSIVLCAAGAWSSFFCRSLGIKVPQIKVKGTVAITNPIETKINGNIFDKRVSIRKRLDGGYTIAHGAILDHPITPSTLYFAPKYIQALIKEFNVLKISIGKEFIEELAAPKIWDLDKVSPFETNRVLNPEPNKNIIEKISNQIGKVYPELKDAEIIESWAGMVETTPDVVPIIAPLKKIPGFYLATGFSGHGFGIGPGAGKVISKMIQNKPTIDLHPFRLERFFDGSPIKVDSTI